ncbi:MAG: BlaI/MecI/CopY family transcriptional regulator [Bacteroidales bacterium]
MERLTLQEEEVMQRIWKIGDCVVKDIVNSYDLPQPPYTTVASIVKNLERKKFVSSRRFGNTYQYSPIVDEENYKRSFLSKLVENYFSNSYKSMVSFFAKEDNISTDELKEIIDMIEKKK